MKHKNYENAKDNLYQAIVWANKNCNFIDSKYTFFLKYFVTCMNKCSFVFS